MLSMYQSSKYYLSIILTIELLLSLRDKKSFNNTILNQKRFFIGLDVISSKLEICSLLKLVPRLKEMFSVLQNRNALNNSLTICGGVKSKISVSI